MSFLRGVNLHFYIFSLVYHVLNPSHGSLHLQITGLFVRAVRTRCPASSLSGGEKKISFLVQYPPQGVQILIALLQAYSARVWYD